MTNLFTPWKINNLELSNRLVRSATWEGASLENGAPSEDTIRLTADVANGGAGLVITGYAYIRADGLALPRQTGIHNDDMIGPMTALTDAVHKSGGKVAIQLVHGGGSTAPGFLPGRKQIFGPTAMKDPVFQSQVEELSTDHIQDIVEDFGKAAVRSKNAGFDVIQLHGAHGYLINQFLSPDRNQRQDEYGGSLENRARFLFDVYKSTRKAVGPDYPLFIKLNTNDATENGFKLQEAVIVSERLDKMGIDAIEVSGGVPAAGQNGSIRKVKDPEDEGYFFQEALAIKKAVSCPVISVGGWRSRSRIEQALDYLDAVAMSRPFICQPDMALLWKQGKSNSAACISCGGCLKQTMKHGLSCVQLKEK